MDRNETDNLIHLIHNFFDNYNNWRFIIIIIIFSHLLNTCPFICILKYIHVNFIFRFILNFYLKVFILSNYLKWQKMFKYDRYFISKINSIFNNLRILTLSFLYNTFEKKNFHQMLIKHQLHRNALIKQIFLAFFFLNNL